MDRSAFLARVREASGGREPSEGTRAPALPAQFPRTPASGDGAPLGDRFARELEAVGGVAQMVEMEGVAEAVAEEVRRLRVEGIVVVTPDADDFREAVETGVAQAGSELVRPGPDRWRADAARADVGITSAFLGVASTGSVLVVPSAESPRVASILPAAHLVILPSDRLVPGLEEAMAALPALADRSSAPFLITGPSRTSDIEMTMVTGAHGPRAVSVVLVRSPRMGDAGA
jgi:L-lactate dehydrogenase complex protein LldG